MTNQHTATPPTSQPTETTPAGPIVTITLPLPLRGLQSNARGGWRVKAPLARRTRQTASEGSCEQIRGLDGFPIEGEIEIACWWRFKAHRRRDRLNLDQWAKSTYDGMTDAGVWHDDSQVVGARHYVTVDPAQPEQLVIEVWRSMRSVSHNGTDIPQPKTGDDR